MSASYILRGARVIDPANGVDGIRDVGVADGLIVPVRSLPKSATVHDLSGLIVAPGFIDLHVHLREPGQTHKEDIATGTRAAAAGGFTTVLAMPNTVPAIDRVDRLAAVLASVRERAAVRVLQTAALSVDRLGKALTDAAALKRVGAAALTDDGTCIQDSALMLEAFRQAREAGLTVIEHCEDERVAAGGAMHDGAVARGLGLRGQPRAGEELIVARDLVLACETGARVHLQHLSSAGSVAWVRCARSQGITVTAEVTPHHLCLTHNACIEYGTNAKMNPPLREESDRRALISGLQDGTITVIATDHAPHSAEEKAASFERAPFGIVGFETAVPVCLNTLWHGGLLSLPRLIAAFTQGPRDVLGMTGCGSLEAGAPADITILDVEREVVLDTATFRSKSRNCPYNGWRCRGAVAATVVGGEWVFSTLPGIAGRV